MQYISLSTTSKELYYGKAGNYRPINAVECDVCPAGIIIVLGYVKIQEVFIVNLYRSLHKMFDMLFSTNTTKGG